ncbi:MAG TPA: hypothetical protein VF898_10905 [Chloroflexota bacterium]
MASPVTPAATPVTPVVAPHKLLWTIWHTVVIVGIAAAVVLTGILTPSSYRVWAWIVIMALLLLFIVVTGHGITGLWRGALIDEQNTMSLSRLQMSLWTIVVLSAFLTAALDNVHTKQTDPLSIAIPVEVWALLGITTTALIATPLILNVQKLQPLQTPPGGAAGEQSEDAFIRAQGLNPDQQKAVGQVVMKIAPQLASWGDIFTGDQIGNGAHLDLAKIQMFYFTLVLVVAYAVALGALFTATGPIKSFPVVNQAMVALLGISNAGYLANKVIPHPPVAS